MTPHFQTLVFSADFYEILWKTQCSFIVIHSFSLSTYICCTSTSPDEAGVLVMPLFDFSSGLRPSLSWTIPGSQVCLPHVVNTPRAQTSRSESSPRSIGTLAPICSPVAGLIDAVNHLVGPTHSLFPIELGSGHGDQALCYLTDLTRIPGPSPGDLANGLLGIQCPWPSSPRPSHLASLCLRPSHRNPFCQ